MGPGQDQSKNPSREKQLYRERGSSSKTTPSKMADGYHRSTHMVDRALAHHSGKGTGYRKETNTSALSLFHTKNRFDLLKLSSNDEYNECNEYFVYDVICAHF